MPLTNLNLDLSTIKPDRAKIFAQLRAQPVQPTGYSGELQKTAFSKQPDPASGRRAPRLESVDAKAAYDRWQNEMRAKHAAEPQEYKREVHTPAYLETIQAVASPAEQYRMAYAWSREMGHIPGQVLDQQLPETKQMLRQAHDQAIATLAQLVPDEHFADSPQDLAAKIAFVLGQRGIDVTPDLQHRISQSCQSRFDMEKQTGRGKKPVMIGFVPGENLYHDEPFVFVGTEEARPFKRIVSKKLSDAGYY